MPFPFIHANGRICCSNPDGCCDNCKAKLTAEKRTLRSASDADYAPLDPYAADLAKRRAAEATPESRFAEQYAAERTREFAAEQTATTLRTAERPARRVLTAADLKQFEPPNPYRALDKGAR